jgi:transcriptional regulator GlxA family with amidase domain
MKVTNTMWQCPSQVRLETAMDKRVTEILDILKSSPPGSAAIAQAARRVGLSPAEASRLFKAQTGITMRQCHKELRLIAAKELLGHNALTLRAC